ncbi:hypothetical protein BHK98_06490 [Hornefia porci]|uniref:Lipoprotein n=1 Tax=Hornefia porci TaxID=2652292 RepID=A0A1Q9JHX8_9FIRM|nr:hypothetical protein [Hornefia porci]OLR55741.1 hypothetical protein BHK98_06490 [Hornefia porci]
MKKIIVLLMAILTVTLCACANENESKTSEVKDVTVQSDYTQYEYEALKRVSEIIVKAEIQDDLSEKNSIIERDSDDPESVSGFSAVREIKILDVYAGKEKIKAGDTIKIIEDAAMDGGYYYHGENYESLKKGAEYILFLNKDNAAGEYSIISADNGKVCTSDFEDMKDLNEENFEVAVKTLVEFNSDLDDKEKSKIIEGNVYRSTNKEASRKEVELPSGVMKYDYTNKGIAVTLK